MIGARDGIGPHLVGEELEPLHWVWNEADAMLYALGVGARPSRDLPYVYEGKGPLVLPTFAAVPTARRYLELVDWLGVNLADVLHAEQLLRIDHLPAASGEATVTRRVTDVWDKGSGAVVVIEDAAEDAGPLFLARSSWWISGAGGFGGERGPSTNADPPLRSPDFMFNRRVAPEQAAIHRLGGDRNPIHIDPAFALEAGFEVPILHGLCTLGMVGLDLVTEFCPREPSRLRQLSARFAAPVLPGEELRTEVWSDGPGNLQLRTCAGERLVLSHGRAEFAIAGTSATRR